jgi:hypothetical protein
MSLPYRKIYIDTRYKTDDSKSNSDFYFELEQPLVCPQGTVFYMSSISIPHSWTTIEPSLNSRLYFFIFDKTNPVTNFSFIVYLSDGNYIGTDLATEIKTKMNAATGAVNAPFSNLFNVVYDIKTNTIQILITLSNIAFYILTPKDLNDKLAGLFDINYDKNNTFDCNEILGNLEGNSAEYDSNRPFRSNYLNMQAIRNLYLHSSIGTYTTLARRQKGYDNTIIAHIAVNSNFNEMIFDELNTVNDWLECGGQTLKKLDFQLKTATGEIVPLHGVNMSFALIFSRNMDLS